MISIARKVFGVTEDAEGTRVRDAAMTRRERSFRPGPMLEIALLGLVMLCLTPAQALAGQATSPSGQIQSVTVSHTSTQGGQATTVVVTTSLSKASGSKASPPTEIDVQLPAGMARNPGSFPTCDAADLEAEGPNACPDAEIGRGSMMLDARPIITDPLPGLITAFNGANGTVLLFLLPDIGPAQVIEGKPSAPNGLNFAVPPLPTLPGQPNATITQLTLDLGFGSYFVNPTTACAQGWTYTFGFGYENGESLSIPESASCTPVALPPFVTLFSTRETETVGHPHCVKAAFRTGTGNPMASVTVRFSVSGTNTASGSPVTDASGNARFCYTGANLGGDDIYAFADTNNDGVRQAGEPDDTTFNQYTDVSQPAMLKLLPHSATNAVGTQHCVTATVGTGSGDPLQGVIVRFAVTGANSADGFETSDVGGQAVFCYTGQNPGSDTIDAFADTDGDGLQNSDEPGNEVRKTWLSTSSPSPPSPRPPSPPLPPAASPVGAFGGVKLASQALNVGKNGKLQVSLSCPAVAVGNCAGTDTLKTIGPVAARRKKKRVLTLGSASFSIPAGGTRKVTIKLSKVALKLLAKKHTLKAHEIVVVHDSRGTSKTSTTTLTLKAPKKKSH